MMSSVFLLEHVSRNGASEDRKRIGVYASEDDVHAAVNRFRDLPGFLDDPEGFVVREYTIDEDQWPDGYQEPAPEAP